MFDEAVITLLTLHKHYKNGIMPLTGGLLEQPAYFLEVMDVIDNALKF